MDKTRLALTFSQEIRTETRISNFNLKGDLVGKIYVCGRYVPDYTSEGGVCSALYTVKYKVGGDI